MLNVKTGLIAGMMAFALAGCDNNQPANTTASTNNAATTNTTTSTTANTATNNANADNWTHWVCEEQTQVDWRQVGGQDAVDLRMGGDDIVYRLDQVEAASGVRYTDGRLTFHTKGNSGILYWNDGEENIDVDCKER